ncbi:hypothetical protein PQG02_27525 [Nostoc sp. UHCC 0926]|nr:hypothetical protein [Nostoc sp. UHCC 0926]WDD32369.1 hypothetical protein PQG02_27525 [Nostoc sp. UHCC 0926]
MRSKLYCTQARTAIVGFVNGGQERTGDRIYQGELYAIYIVLFCDR